MSRSLFRFGGCRRLPLLALLWASAIAQAQNQTPARPDRADPLDARAPVPAVTHSSALAGYRRLGEDRRVDWKAANETVNRIGGWKAYAREAQQPEPAASTPAVPASSASSAARQAPPPAPRPAPAHGGHHRH